jgi:hypothetical protein
VPVATESVVAADVADALSVERFGNSWSSSQRTSVCVALVDGRFLRMVMNWALSVSLRPIFGSMSSTRSLESRASVSTMPVAIETAMVVVLL